jgi:hypothetical protein
VSNPLYGQRFDRQSQYRDRLAAQLLAQGSDASPVQHWTQGAARLAQALAGGMIGMKQDERYAEREKQSSEAMAKLFAPSQQFVPSAAGVGPRLGAQMQTAQPTLAEMAQRAAAHPATQHLAPQFQMQAAAAQQALANRVTYKPAEQNGLKGQIGSDGKFIPDPLPRPGAQPQRYMNVGGQLIDVSGDKPRVAYQAPAEPAKEQGGPFAGNALDAQALNIVLNPRADTSSPTYAAAFTHLYGPRSVTQPDQTTVVMQPPIPEGVARPGAQQRPQAAPNALSQFSIGGGGMPQGMPAAPPPQAAAQQPPAAPPNSATTQLPGGGSVTRVGDPKPKEMTEGQTAAALYADRMAKAEPIIQQLGQAGTSWTDKVASGVPLIGNSLVSNDYQKLDQARRDFVNAVLRRESGAVIADSEFENANRQYFPQPGDGPDVIAQKAQNRKTALEGISRAAGPTYSRAAPAGGDIRSKSGLE